MISESLGPHRASLSENATAGKKQRSKLKYELYFVPSGNPEAKAPHSPGIWLCDKCRGQFSSFSNLRAHKRSAHAY